MMATRCGGDASIVVPCKLEDLQMISISPFPSTVDGMARKWTFYNLILYKTKQ